MVKSKIKIFERDAKDTEINKFIEDNVLLRDGIVIRNSGRIYILYITKEQDEKQTLEDRPNGLDKDGAAIFLSNELGKIQSNRIAEEAKLRFFRSKDVQGHGSQEVRTEVTTTIFACEKSIENYTTQIRQYRELIKEIYDGKYVL